MWYSKYDTATGRLTGEQISIPNTTDVLAQLGPGEGVVEGRFNYETHYVEGGEVKEWPMPPVAQDKVEITGDGLDVATLSGVPAGAVVTVAQKRLIADATGVIEITSDDTGAVLMISVKADGYQPWRGELWVQA